MTTPAVPFRHGDARNVPDHLNAEFSAVGASVVGLEDEVAAGNLALHGTGTEAAAGLTLSIGTGLSCRVLNGAFWVGGRRYEISELVGYLVAPVEINTTRHLYMDTSLQVTSYAAKQSPNPAGTWYLGTATTNATACTAVNDSVADRIASVATLGGRVSDLETDITGLQTAVGIPYSAGVSLDSRVTDLESAGGGTGGGPAYWGGLDKAAGDATTIDQEIDGAVTAHVAALHGAVADGGGGSTPDPVLPWDVDAVNQAAELLKLTRSVDPDLPATQVDAVVVVWSVFGDGTGGTPDFIDRVNSTWLPVA